MEKYVSRFRALGPGLLMATAAIGGSHLVASTQAGALFGWQLFGLIILINVLKYPFFRFAVDYTMNQRETLVHGYFRQGRSFLVLFTVLAVVAAIVNTAGVLLLSANLLKFMLPGNLDIVVVSGLLLFGCVLFLLLGEYRALDLLARVMMVVLTVLTVVAVTYAFVQLGPQGNVPAEFISPSPWDLAALAFLVAMMGWMPAPIEISVINSIWLQEKRRVIPLSRRGGLFDFNVGFWTTAVLALCFLSLGALIQHGAEQEIAMGGSAFAEQLVGMYAVSLGDWTRWLVVLVAFFCMFGTTLTVLDGYARGLHISSQLLIGGVDHTQGDSTNSESNASTPGFLSLHGHGGYCMILIVQALAGLGIIAFFRGALAPMLAFAMTAAFLTTPLFAWLNFTLARRAATPQQKLTKKYKMLHAWAWLGLIYLIGFALFYLAWLLFLR